jgi:hypothetical protein
MPGTWAAASRAVGVGENQFFDPAAQDKAANYLVSQRLGGLEPGAELTPEVLDRLAPEWASLPTAKGASYYGQPVKKRNDLNAFYRQRLAAIKGGDTGGAAGSGSPLSASTSAAPATGAGGEVDWGKVLFGGSEEAPKPATGTRMAMGVGLVPGAMAQVEPGRMAGDKAEPKLDPLTGAFVAAVGGPRRSPEQAAAKGDDLFSSVMDDYKQETVESAGPGAAKGLAGVASSAEKSFGMSTRTGPDGGNNACLYAVNKVLGQAGYTPPWGNSQYVPDARRALASGAGFLVEKPEPGDIAIMRDNHEKDPYPHIGIVTSGGRILSNSSSRGKFDWDGSAEDYSRYYGRAPEFWRLGN